MKNDPSPAPTATPRRPEVSSASVQIGPREIRYLRRGSGAPLLLLVTRLPGKEALAALAELFRVVVPEFPPPEALRGEALTRWVCDLIDGLGLEQVVVLADEGTAVELKDSAAFDPDRVSRIIALGAGDGLERAGEADPACAQIRLLAGTRGESFAASWSEAAAALVRLTSHGEEAER
jgi:pimeloyl-ACP methyl ester carboxylesterase